MTEQNDAAAVVETVEIPTITGIRNGFLVLGPDRPIRIVRAR